MRMLLTLTALFLATSARADGPPVWDGSYATPAIIQLVTAPVVIQDQPPVVEGRAPDRIAELERRVAALEAEHAKMGLRAPSQSGGTVIAETGPIHLGSGPTTARLMPVPAGYQTRQATSSSYFAASVPVGLGDAGACASGDCGAGGRSSRVAPFGGRFRRR